MGFNRLSAVDAHTARHLVVNCFSGPLMKHRTCILVTHHVRLCLPVAAMAVKMTDGRAEIQELDETDLADLTELAEVDEGPTTPAITSKEQTPGNMTPMHGALITKEHRETVRHLHLVHLQRRRC